MEEDNGNDTDCQQNVLDYTTKYGEIIDHKTLRSKDCIDAYMIVKNLYLGSYEEAAAMDEGLRVIGITHILSIGHARDMPQMFKDRITYHFIELEDAEYARIDLHLEEAIEYISSALASGGKVLVHCWAGVSRSATLIMSYLIKTFNMSYTEAYETTRKARYWVRPNKGFRKKLIAFAKKCKRGEPQGVYQLIYLTNSENIEMYDKARAILKSLYKNRITVEQQSEVREIFETVFGRFHIHTLDVIHELTYSE